MTLNGFVNLPNFGIRSRLHHMIKPELDCLRQKCSRKMLVFGSILFIVIFVNISRNEVCKFDVRYISVVAELLVFKMFAFISCL